MTSDGFENQDFSLITVYMSVPFLLKIYIITDNNMHKVAWLYCNTSHQQLRRYDVTCKQVND